MSLLGDIRTDIHGLLTAALPSLPVYEYEPDDIQDAPCVFQAYTTVSRSFVTSGQSIVRASVFCVAYRGAPEDTLVSMDDLVSAVWQALGSGGALRLATSGGMSQPQSAYENNITVGDVAWPAMRVDTDIQTASAFC